MEVYWYWDGIKFPSHLDYNIHNTLQEEKSSSKTQVATVV